MPIRPALHGLRNFLYQLTPYTYNLKRAFRYADPQKVELFLVRSLVTKLSLQDLDTGKVFAEMAVHLYNYNLTLSSNPSRFVFFDDESIELLPDTLSNLVYGGCNNPKKLIQTCWRLGYPDIAARFKDLMDRTDAWEYFK